MFSIHMSDISKLVNIIRRIEYSFQPFIELYRRFAFLSRSAECYYGEKNRLNLSFLIKLSMDLHEFSGL